MGLSQPTAVRLGTSQAYLVPVGDGYVLVDAGVPYQERRFAVWLTRFGISPQAVRLIFVTHVHYDHVGSLHGIARYCRAPVLVHRVEAPLLAGGKVVVPPGLTPWGKAASALLKTIAFLGRYSPHEAEIVVGDEGASLADFAPEARVLHTPGHTPGSLSLLLAGGIAFVGDLCSNDMPVGRRPIFPPFGYSRETVFASWRRLLDAGATLIYPGHGPPFPAGILRAWLAREDAGVGPRTRCD